MRKNPGCDYMLPLVYLYALLSMAIITFITAYIV